MYSNIVIYTLSNSNALNGGVSENGNDDANGIAIFGALHSFAFGFGFGCGCVRLANAHLPSVYGCDDENGCGSYDGVHRLRDLGLCCENASDGGFGCGCDVFRQRTYHGLDGGVHVGFFHDAYVRQYASLIVDDIETFHPPTRPSQQLPWHRRRENRRGRDIGDLPL